MPPGAHPRLTSTSRPSGQERFGFFSGKDVFLGPCRWLAGSRLATVVMPGGFCQPLFRAVCQAAGGTGQPSRSGDPLVSGAPCCVGPWQGPKAPVPPALRQRGPGGAPSWPGAAAVRRTLPSRPPASGLLVEILLALHPEFSFSRATEGSHRPERPSAGPHGGAACSPRGGAPFSVCRGDLRLEAAGPPREETRPPSCQNCSLCALPLTNRGRHGDFPPRGARGRMPAPPWPLPRGGWEGSGVAERADVLVCGARARSPGAPASRPRGKCRARAAHARGQEGSRVPPGGVRVSGGRPGSALLVLPWRRAGVGQSAQGREAPGRHLRRLPPSKSPKRFVRPAVPRPAAEAHFGTGGQPRPRDKRGPRAAGFCPAPRPRPDWTFVNA